MTAEERESMANTFISDLSSRLDQKSFIMGNMNARENRELVVGIFDCIKSITIEILARLRLRKASMN